MVRAACRAGQQSLRSSKMPMQENQRRGMVKTIVFLGLCLFVTITIFTGARKVRAIDSPKQQPQAHSHAAFGFEPSLIALKSRLGQLQRSQGQDTATGTVPALSVPIAGNSATGTAGTNEASVPLTVPVYSALLGACIALAVALPLAERFFWQPQAAAYRRQVASARAHCDGMMQAMAFAAHEIRNPLHAVGASLESGLHDLLPLYRLLAASAGQQGAGEVDTSASPYSDAEAVCTWGTGPTSSISSSKQALALQRALGPEACAAVRGAIEDIGVANGSAHTCHRLVNDMVDYSKLQKGSMSIQRAPMDVRASLRRLMESQRAFVHSEVGMWLRVHKDVPQSLYIDEGRFLQVLANSLTNAAKFTFTGNIWLTAVVLDGSPYPALCLPHNPGTQYLCLAACDTGMGLKGVNVNRLFEPMHAAITQAQLDDAGMDAESGPLGLMATAHAYVAQSWMGTRRAMADRLRRMSQWVEGLPAEVEEEQEGGRPPAIYGAVTTPKLVASAVGGRPVIPAAPAAPATTVTASKAASRGSGLGLPVARLMARAMGGDIDLYTEEDTPIHIPVTRFIFLMPMSAVDPSQVQPTGPAVPCPMYGRGADEHQAGQMRDGTRALIRSAFGGCVADVEQTLYLDFPPTKHRGGLGEQPSAVVRPQKESAALLCTYQAQAQQSVPVTTPSLAEGSPTAEQDSTSETGLFAVPSVRGGMLERLSEELEESESDMDAAGEWGRRERVVHDAPPRMADKGSAAGARSVHSAISLMTANRSVLSGPAEGGRRMQESVPPLRQPAAGQSTAEGAESTQTVRAPLTAAVRGHNSVGRRHKAQQTGEEHTVQLPLRVLYAEDDAVNRRLMGRLLRHCEGLRCAILCTAKPGVPGADIPACESKVQLTLVEDGWQAVQALYKAGQLGEQAYERARAHVLATGAVSQADVASGLSPDKSDQHCTSLPFDLILLDVDMPHFSGDQIAAYLREKSGCGHSHAPVLAVTGRSVGFHISQAWANASGQAVVAALEGLGKDMPGITNEIEDHFLQDRFDGTLGKPFNAGQLAAVVRLTMARIAALHAHVR